MELEFYTPSEAAKLMKCTENFLREQAYAGSIPHCLWARNTLIFTSEHIHEIARLRTQPARTAVPAETPQELTPASDSSVRQIGTLAKKRRA